MWISKRIFLLLIPFAQISIVAAQDFGVGTDLYPNNIEIGAGPMHWAAAENNLDEMQRLMDSGVPVDDRATRSFSTPLHLAARDGQLQAAEWLLEHGADVHATNEHVPFGELVNEYDLVTAIRLGMDFGGITPLHLAVRSQHYDLVELLLDAGAEVDIKSYMGGTPLHGFTSTADLKIGEALRIAELLLEEGADVNATDAGGATPLHSAIAVGGSDDNSEIIAFLIDHGADINIPAEDGNTALHAAAREGKEGTVSLLIERGADVNARNSRGETPLGVADSRRVRRILREHGGAP